MKKPTYKEMAEFCRQQAKEQREMKFCGMAVLRPEGFPDLTYMTPNEIDEIGTHYEILALKEDK